jgi:hypothetical protein
MSRTDLLVNRGEVCSQPMMISSFRGSSLDQRSQVSKAGLRLSSSKHFLGMERHLRRRMKIHSDGRSLATEQEHSRTLPQSASRISLNQPDWPGSTAAFRSRCYLQINLQPDFARQRSHAHLPRVCSCPVDYINATCLLPTCTLTSSRNRIRKLSILDRRLFLHSF